MQICSELRDRPARSSATTSGTSATAISHSGGDEDTYNFDEEPAAAAASMTSSPPKAAASEESSSRRSTRSRRRSGPDGQSGTSANNNNNNGEGEMKTGSSSAGSASPAGEENGREADGDCEAPVADAENDEVRMKLRTTLCKFGEFWADIAYLWLARLGRNHFVNTKFSKLSKEISDPSQQGRLSLLSRLVQG